MAKENTERERSFCTCSSLILHHHIENLQQQVDEQLVELANLREQGDEKERYIRELEGELSSRKLHICNDEQLVEIAELRSIIEDFTGRFKTLIERQSKETHDKYHNPMECSFYCEYGDDRGED